jgi:ubiquinone/menaquinone biosynthesis C-methylase UbiE
MAAIYDWFMRDLERACGDEWRRELLADVAGDVLEIGAGTGKNLDHYRFDAIRRLVLAEPDRHMRKKLEARAAQHADVTAWAAESLEAPAASFDVVVATLVLCSVGDVARVLAETRRVLRPGGRLIFFEHVVAPDASRRAWQRRVEPVWRRIAGNCHLTRDTERAIVSGGFTIERITRESARKAMPIVRPTIRGVAIA